MISFYKLLLSVVVVTLLLALCSCSEDAQTQPFGEPENGEQTVLRVSGAIAGNDPEVETRVTGRTIKVLAAGSQIGVFLKDMNGYKPIFNQLFEHGTPFWKSSEEIMLGNNKTILAAYYPYDAGRTNPVLLKSQPRLDNTEDLCCTNLEVDKNSSTISLNLSRVHSLIEFKFTNPGGGDGYAGAGKVEAIKLEGAGISSAAQLDLLTKGAFTGGNLHTILTPIDGGVGVKLEGFKTEFTATKEGTAGCLMIPALLDGNIRVTFTIDGIEMTANVTAEQLCGPDKLLKEGTKYAVNLKVTKTTIEVNSIYAMIGWEDNNVQNDTGGGTVLRPL